MATIVWIEDDTPIIDRTVWRIEEAGHTVIRIASMSEALQRTPEVLNSDLILLDLITPEGPDNSETEFPGVGFLRALRKMEVNVPPVVVLTWVSHDDEVMAQCVKLGVADIIQKPVSPSQLKERVDVVLGAQRSAI
jgi:CheY-like chemotaxis protein